MKCRPRKSEDGRGNQVRVLSDPVTVTEERSLGIPLYVRRLCFRQSALAGREEPDSMRRGEKAMILEPGNLLCMARLNFRVKYNNQPGISAVPECCLLLEAGIFYGISPVRMNYTSCFCVRSRRGGP